MDDLKYCSLIKKYNDDYDISKISKAVVFRRNEGLILTIKGEVFFVNNSGFIKLGIFSKKNVIDFAYAKSIVNSKLELVLVLTEYEIYGWGQNTYQQVQYIVIVTVFCFYLSSLILLSCSPN